MVEFSFASLAMAKLIADNAKNRKRIQFNSFCWSHADKIQRKLNVISIIGQSLWLETAKPKF